MIPTKRVLELMRPLENNILNNNFAKEIFILGIHNLIIFILGVIVLMWSIRIAKSGSLIHY